MNSYRSIVIFLLIALIAVAFWGAIRYFGILKEQRPPVIIPHQEQTAATIHITARGFDPQRIEIMKGETVEFVNEDIKPHWPASAVHPVHAQCSGFDALRGLAQKERYQYTFLKSQTCSFHDHLNPSFTGVIIIK